MDGDSWQFEQFVVARTPALLRFAYALTSDVALAEDLVQEALIKTHRNSETPTGHLPDRAGLDTTESRLVERDAMWRALADLPRRQRAAMVLRFYEDLPDTQIAEVLGCSPATARSLTSRASRALQTLRGHDPATAPTPGGQA